MTLLIKPLESVLTWVLRVGRHLAWIALGLMVVVTLLQVYYRYVLGSALPWPDEAARFLMLWMTGLIAPSAYRWGGFVSIDMLRDLLGKHVSLILALLFLIVSLAVLIIALQLGWKHINSGWLFKSSTLKIPMQFFGGDKAVKMPLAWMYLSLFTGFVLMTLVNIEMILKHVHMLFDPEVDYSEAPDQIVLSAE